MRGHRSPPPLWFLLCVAVVTAWVFRCYASSGGWGAGGDGHALQVQQAFFGFLLGLASIIFRGLEVAGKVALTILQWSVKALWLFATATANGLKALGLLLRDGLWKAWDFLRATYDHVLKPVWSKFWRWFDKFRRWLDDTFGPVLHWLRRLRDTLIRFWATYVRPILDIIDATRRVLRVLSSLGLHWAAALDAKLASLEEKIEAPFRALLQKVNEIINIVNRVVTLDGLVQRVALIRSLVRDYQFAWNVIKNAYDRPLTSADRQALKDKNAPATPAAIDEAAVTYIQTGAGPRAAVFEEMYLTVRSRVRARP